MAWKVGGAIALLLVLFGMAGTAAVGPEADRAVSRQAYRVPAEIPFPDDNPYTPAKAELGRRLFFDPILSGDYSRACVSCHVPDLGWADGRARALSRHDGVMDLRTPTLLNLAWQERLGWDGKFRDLETVAFLPITAAGNMNLSTVEALRRLTADASYAKAFADAFADPEITKDRVEDALATFERLIVSGPTPFDRWIAGDETAIDTAAKRGFDLFNGKARCAACHSGWSFTDGSFHDIGTAKGADIGRGRFFPNSPALLYAFKTPGLRSVAERAPYMHDGSLPTLEAVVDLYDRGGIERPSRSPDIRPLGLSAREKADLLAFLRTLSTKSGTVPAMAELPPIAPRPSAAR
ncbi:cytochrome-c peroxidase [Methylobacterium planeticum]|uniref:Methylamine utilization protein MauG n=1 Tax=Methylobacterium planeticum TaxID=2615211 RepID=A0A6N6MGJ8_9HYPH|nr:cytochrome c peroxidase [Methylobacterium planeticum]KAB1068535.1 c-type cytochrome [Methylobacterium planeticum]